MDPNETLARLRALVVEARNAETDEQAATACDEMANVAEALDDWLSNGGFLPDAWQREEENGEAEAVCPACDDPIDYCQCHGEIGDPEGFAILQAEAEGR